MRISVEAVKHHLNIVYRKLEFYSESKNGGRSYYHRIKLVWLWNCPLFQVGMVEMGILPQKRNAKGQYAL